MIYIYIYIYSIKKNEKKDSLENKDTRPTNYKVKSTIQNCIEKICSQSTVAEALVIGWRHGSLQVAKFMWCSKIIIETDSKNLFWCTEHLSLVGHRPSWSRAWKILASCSLTAPSIGTWGWIGKPMKPCSQPRQQLAVNSNSFSLVFPLVLSSSVMFSALRTPVIFLKKIKDSCNTLMTLFLNKYNGFYGKLF